MCDYSLMHAKSRPAVKDEELVIHNFNAGSNGFTGAKDVLGPHPDGWTAVCLLPGTQLAVEGIEVPKWCRYDKDQQDPANQLVIEPARRVDDQVAVFSKRYDLGQYHDALEFADGTFVPVSKIEPGARARVLQMPAETKPETSDRVTAVIDNLKQIAGELLGAK